MLLICKTKDKFNFRFDMFCWEMVALSVPIPLRVHGYLIRSSFQKSVLRKSNRFDGEKICSILVTKKLNSFLSETGVECGISQQCLKTSCRTPKLIAEVFNNINNIVCLVIPRQTFYLSVCIVNQRGGDTSELLITTL